VNDPSFPGEMAIETKRVRDMVGGKTLGLFTSWKNLNAVHERLVGNGHRILLDYGLFQGRRKEAFELVPAEEDAYDIDDTIRVIHEIDVAVQQSNSLDEWLGQLAGNDYRYVAPEVRQARVRVAQHAPGLVRLGGQRFEDSLSKHVERIGWAVVAISAIVIAWLMMRG